MSEQNTYNTQFIEVVKDNSMPVTEILADVYNALSEKGYKDMQIKEISAGIEDCFMRLS